MKYITLFFLILLGTLAADIKWVDYEGIGEKAKQENKLVMIMISQTGCDACWFMDEIVFKNKEVSAEMQKSFLSAYFDIAKDFAPDEFAYFGTPTIYFLTTDGREIDHFVGALNVKDFTAFIHNVKAKSD